jgi:phosphohistidine phosphatase
MKTLFLVRHAKSSWDNTALPDKDRPLADRGKRDAPKMGRRLLKRDVKPDLILSSPATRTLSTAELIAKKLDYKRKNIAVHDCLYPGGVDDLLNVIHKLDDKLERVMLFGHNPGLTELAHRLSSEITHVPTCAVAAFTFDAAGKAHSRSPMLPANSSRRTIDAEYKTPRPRAARNRGSH